MLSDDHALDHAPHVRGYVAVFVALLALTVITVSVSYLHLSVPLAITVALIIAAIKGTLVACYFMHLISERRLIYWVLAVTVGMFIVLLFLPVLTSTLDQAGS